MSTTDREIAATCLLNAPREIVFDVWTDPKHIVHWWGPNGFTNTIHEMDVRPGGVWRFIMHGPDGTNYQNEIVYEEITRLERIVYTHVSHPKFHTTVTFADEGGKTRLTMRMVFETAADRDLTIKTFNAVEGLKETLGRLDGYLANAGGNGHDTSKDQRPGERDILITRVFDAPRERVFKAWTEPAQLMRWWAPRGFTTPVCKTDPRPGGIFHYCMRAPDGPDIWGIGIYQEIIEPERIVYTDSFADADGNPVPPSHYGMSASHPAETLVTVTFTDQGGRTKVTLRHSIPPSIEERDATNQGWIEMLDRLAEELARNRQAVAS
jgi:uncharacterized protein YndB with AHSA1/START domain